MDTKNKYIITRSNVWHKDYYDQPIDYRQPIKRAESTVPINERLSKRINLNLNTVLGLHK